MRFWDNASALRRLYHWLYICIIVCLLASITVWAMHSSYFPVRHIKVVHALQHVKASEIENVSKQYLYGNIFTVDVNAAQQTLARLPWVAKVQVKRVWPDTVQLDIQEREVLARWQDGRLVDQNSLLFSAQTQEPLPMLSGSDKNSHNMVVQLLLFENMLHSADLKVAQLRLNERSAWDVMLNNGILIRLGRERERERLSRFITIWPQVLKNQAANIDYVDMRYPDGFALRYKQKGANIDSDSVTSINSVAVTED